MITFFNKLGNSWVAKIILGALALSMFAFWGLGGLANVSSYNTTNDVVQVGKKGISVQQLHNAFESARKTLNQFAGQNYLSPAKAVETGLLDKVMQAEITTAVQDSLIDEMGLTASNESISAYIEQNKTFADNTGKFDKNLFYAYLMQSGMSETQLAHKLKKELAFKHFQDSILGLGYAPDVFVKAINAYKNEKRNVSALILNPHNIKVETTPTEDDLKNYYESYAEELMNPEFRTLTIALLTPDMMMDRVTVNEDDIALAYEEQKDKYNKPEERDLYQMFFKTQEEAEAVMETVTAENFIATASEKTTQKEEDTHFGYTAKNQLMEELADIVFDAEMNEVVGPIQSQAGWHILWVKDIKEAKITPEDEVKAEIKKALASEQTYDAIEDLSRQLEDILGAGKSLTDATTQLNIPTVQIKEIDVSGQLSDGSSLNPEYKNAELLQNVFTLKKGDVSSLIQHQNGYIIAQIDDITPVAVKSYDSVKDHLKSIWMEDQQKGAFDGIVNSFKEQIQKGKSVKDLAQTEKGNFELIEEEALLRSDTTILPIQVINTVFNQEIGLNNVQSVPVNNSVILTVVNSVQKTIDTPITQELTEQTKTATGVELDSGFFQAYFNRLGYTVNPNQLQTLINQYKVQD